MYNNLTEEEKNVIIHKGTEPPFQNEYDDLFVDGVYICRQCSQPLFSAKTKFDSGCGWPSFDENYPNAVTRIPDADGQRTEIVCSNCRGHLGHVFEGEKMTDKNTRHCVNSVSIRFIPQKAKNESETVYFGGGCFWCTEAVFKRIKGVKKVTSGYSGGNVEKPTDNDIYNGNTGHAEVIKIEFDNKQLDLDQLLMVFFETHDPTTLNRQGYDRGEQYRSIIFYTTLDQKTKSETYIKKLEESKKYGDKKIVTKIQPFISFYNAANYHQDYYEKNPYNSYCQFIIAPKVEKLEKLDVPLKNLD